MLTNMKKQDDMKTMVIAIIVSLFSIFFILNIQKNETCNIEKMEEEIKLENWMFEPFKIDSTKKK